MSDPVYQNNAIRCQGWVNPEDVYFGPTIGSLSSYYSPAGSTTLVSINGSNFYSYSSVAFGTYYPTTYFINSNLIQFYIPSTLNAGTFTVQVFNGSFPSNIVNYTIDNASGYWLLNSNGNINNTNFNLVSMTSLSRGLPVTITSAPITDPFIIPFNVTWVICNSNTDVYVSLPSGSQYIGREITIKAINTTGIVYSVDGNNIIPLETDVTGVGDIIISSGGSTSIWATLIYDGTYWTIMAGC